MAATFDFTNYLNSSFPSTSSTPITISCWASKSRSVPAGTQDTLVYLTNSSLGGRLSISINGDEYPVAAVGDPYAQSVRTVAIANNVWTNIIGLFRSSTYRVVFSNGNIGTANTTSVTVPSVDTIEIGSVGGVADFAGRLAEVAVWNVELNSFERASLADGFSPDKIRPQNLIYYAPLIRDFTELRNGLAITNNNNVNVFEHPRIY